MSLIINSWNGRLANNIIQIIRAIHYATLNNYNNILFNKHAALSDNQIIINNILDNNKATINNSFFYPKQLNFIDPEPYIMKKYFQTYIAPIFFVNPCNKDIQNNTNDLYIHIRSGDCITNQAHSFYVPPPLSYYKKIIEIKNWNKINIIYEDDKNPCVNLLKNRQYSNTEFISSSVQNDLTILSQCENLVIGFGTFGLLIYFLSKSIKNIYIPKYAYDEMPKGDWGININVIDMPGYIKCGEWKFNNNNLNKIYNYI